MAYTIHKEKINENVQVNFNQSKEIAHWAKQLNIEPKLFQQIFAESGYSISKTFAAVNTRRYVH